MEKNEEKSKENGKWNKQTLHGLPIVRIVKDSNGDTHVICKQKNERYSVCFFYDLNTGEFSSTYEDFKHTTAALVYMIDSMHTRTEIVSSQVVA